MRDIKFTNSEANAAQSEVARVNKDFNNTIFMTWKAMQVLPRGVFIDPSDGCIFFKFAPKRIPGMFNKYFHCQEVAHPVSLYLEQDKFRQALNATLKHFTQLAKDEWFKIDKEVEKSIEVRDDDNPFT